MPSGVTSTGSSSAWRRAAWTRRRPRTPSSARSRCGSGASSATSTPIITCGSSVPELDGATLVTWIRAVLRRDLATLRRELDLYADDAGPWREVPGLANCGGTLALHLAGNLRHFVGARLGTSGYVRDRTAEFA